MRYCTIILITKRDKKSQRARNNRPYREKSENILEGIPRGDEGTYPPFPRTQFPGCFTSKNTRFQRYVYLSILYIYTFMICLHIDLCKILCLLKILSDFGPSWFRGTNHLRELPRYSFAYIF